MTSSLRPIPGRLPAVVLSLQVEHQLGGVVVVVVVVVFVGTRKEPRGIALPASAKG